MRETRSPIVLLILAIFLMGAAAPADGEVERLIGRFVEAFNSGDAERMKSFYEEGATDAFRERRTDEEDRALYRKLWDDLGELTSPRIESEDGGGVRLTAETGRAGEPVTFAFDIAPGSPPRIQGFSIRLGRSPGAGGNPLPPIGVSASAGPAAVRAAIDRYLARLADDGVFSGSVLVSRGDEIVFEGAYGLANRESRSPNTTDTKFDIGSITKMITKAAIGRLARDGKLTLDDRLIDHVPDYPNPEVARKITVGQLVAHSSGLGDIFNERFEKKSKDRLRAPRDFFPIFADEPLKFEPGEGRSYSNAGYVVLGAVVEGASGVPYADYVRKHIFEPAGMKQSGFLVRDGSRSDLAIGYAGARGESPKPNLGMLPLSGCPAGSSSHTARDLLRFDGAVRSGKLLGPGWTEWFYTGDVPSAEERRGRPVRADHPLGVAGGGPGVNAMMESGGGGAVIVLANLDPPIAGDVLKRLLEVVESPAD